MPRPPSFRSPAACGLVRQLSECHGQDVHLVSPSRSCRKHPRRDPEEQLGKYNPIFTDIIPFSHPSIQSVLRIMVLLEQNKKQLGINAFPVSIHYLCETHITRSVRRHGTGTLKSSDCPLEDRRDSSWLDAARDCHSIGEGCGL